MLGLLIIMHAAAINTGLAIFGKPAAVRFDQIVA